MAMRRFLLDKLCRDNLIEQNNKNNIITQYYFIEDEEEYLEALAAKIAEEFEEVLDAESKEEVVNELADLEDVIHEFKNFLKINQADIDKARIAKRLRNGGFEKRIYAEYVDVPDDSSQITYFEKNAEKYPELSMEDDN